MYGRVRTHWGVVFGRFLASVRSVQDGRMVNPGCGACQSFDNFEQQCKIDRQLSARQLTGHLTIN